MGVPSPRTPVRIARGTKSVLETNKAALDEGEICYATDENTIYVKEGSNLETTQTSTATDSSKMPLAGGTFTGIVNYANGKAIRFYEDSGNGSNYVGIVAPSALSADTTYTLPTADGNADEFLKTNGSGALSWGLSSSGATGGATDAIFVENERTVTTSYSITATKNAHSVGPIAINNNIVVTIPANSTWLVS
mgnify:FL=1|tara:strand:+ start:1532 stop:2110 length:579 start_codon:yes stop_codon:yes gene_type:complete